MALTKISGNQIADSTSAIITTLSFLNTGSVFRLPAGTTAQRPTGISVGTMRFNTTLDAAEVYKADDGTGSAGWSYHSSEWLHCYSRIGWIMECCLNETQCCSNPRITC